MAAASTMTSTSIHEIRQLVPFFLPGEEQTINEQMVIPSNAYASSGANASVKANGANASATSPRTIEVQVREWDHKEGYFNYKTHIVRDIEHADTTTDDQAHTHHRLANKSEGSSPTQRPKSSRPGKKNSPVRNQGQAQVQGTYNMSSTHGTSSKQAQAQTQTLTQAYPHPHPQNAKTTPGTPGSGLPNKPLNFAGTSFEVSSPPPSSLPMPTFITQDDYVVPSFQLEEDSLRRKLKI
mmetsp:Transcript_10052/g.17216  ORF Transcript_10052/g.17216 Transcript_10052/m.17216 type:complete len:238 (-) Transcript_10052:111-824(-)